MDFDVLIAGAGIAGVLAAARLTASFPHARIALVEKSPQPGGRLRSSLQVPGEWGYGLSLVSPLLYEYIQQSLSSNPLRNFDISDLIEHKQQKLAILSGGKLHCLLQKELFSPVAAKILGGPAAAAQWDALWELVCDPAQSNATLAKQGKQLGKNPAATVLTQFGPFCGIPDMWHAPLGAIAARATAVGEGAYFGCWEKVLGELISAQAAPHLTVLNDCPIARATYEDNSWQVVSAKGTLRAKWLLIAQPPWEANEWLDKKSCHPWLWSLASQSTPSSAVVLVERIDGEEEEKPREVIPSTFVAAEEAVVYRLGDSCITGQIIIDYEQSLNSPTVVKAIKQLRRAVAKYKKSQPELSSSGEYLALKAVAWPHLGFVRNQKLEYSEDRSLRQSFCGDAYGSSFLPDENLIESLSNAGMQIAEFLSGEG